MRWNMQGRPTSCDRAVGCDAQVFVAGATGRLGARIVKMLLEKNNQIKVRPLSGVCCFGHCIALA